MNASERGSAADTMPEENFENELCPQCLAENFPGTNFCRKCAAPLSSYSAIGPFESLFAEGYVVRQAAERPRRWIILLGLWGIMLPMTVIGGLLIGFGVDWMGRIGGAAMVAFGLAVLVRVTRGFLRERRRPSAGVESAEAEVDARAEAEVDPGIR